MNESATPAAPVTPTAPAADNTPAPQAPVAPEPTPEVQPAPTPPTEEAPPVDTESDEWEAAEKELLENKGKEQAEPEEEAPEVPSKETTPKEVPEGVEEEAPQDPVVAEREARAAERAAREFVTSIKSDIREKLFANVPTQLQDAEGDPINTIEDVQKLINPRTGEAFTEEEAGMWFLAAQQQFNQNAAKIEKEIEEITDINIALKDEADYINKKYGDTLKNDEGLRDALWAQFEKTLVKDEATGIIKKTPISLEEFYEFQLAPRVETAQSNQNAAAEKAAAEKAAAEKAAAEKAAAEKTRQQERADRSDIYVPPADNNKNKDPEDAEWDSVIAAEYGDRLK